MPSPLRTAARAGLALWSLTMAIAFLAPGEVVAESGLFSYDKLVHLCVFALWGTLALASGWSWRRMAAWGLAFGMASELAQASFPSLHRAGSAADVVADVVGLAVSAGVGWAIKRRRSRAHPGAGEASRPPVETVDAA